MASLGYKRLAQKKKEEEEEEEKVGRWVMRIDSCLFFCFVETGSHPTIAQTGLY